MFNNIHFVTASTHLRCLIILPHRTKHIDIHYQKNYCCIYNIIYIVIKSVQLSQKYVLVCMYMFICNFIDLAHFTMTFLTFHGLVEEKEKWWRIELFLMVQHINFNQGNNFEMVYMLIHFILKKKHGSVLLLLVGLQEEGR